MRFPIALLTALAFLAPLGARAQDSVDEVEVPEAPGAPPPEPEPPPDEPAPEETDDGDRVGRPGDPYGLRAQQPHLVPEPPPVEGELEGEDAPLPLELPEFRLRAASGITLQTTGGTNTLLHLSEEFEWAPPSLEFLAFGVNSAQTTNGGTTIVQAGLRASGFAWFCTDTIVRCSAAVALQLGVVTDSIRTQFDVSADVDVRLLLWETLEVFVRGGFFSMPDSTLPLSFISITAGLGVAFGE